MGMKNNQNGITVNKEIFARIFSRIPLKHIFAALKLRDKGVIYLNTKTNF